MQVAPTYWPAAGGVTGPPGSTTDRGYGWAYQQARDALLASNPKCHWCPAPATTADHEPPIHVVGHAHLNLVPSCGPCNYSRQAGDTAAAAVAWAKAPRLVTVPDVELARLGTWACSTGVCTFAQEDFDSAIAASRDPEVFGAPVKVGHTDPRFASLDGYPSLGWVTNVHQLGDRLRGDLVDVPEPLAEVMSAAFKRRSIEMAWGVRTPSGNRYRAAVVGLALLGVTPPAVSGLADVLSMFHGETTFDVAARAAEGGVTSVVWSEDWPVSPTTAWAAGDTGAGAYFAGGLMPEPMTEARLRQLLALQGEADLEGALVRMRHAASGGAPPAAPPPAGRRRRRRPRASRRPKVRSCRRSPSPSPAPPPRCPVTRPRPSPPGLNWLPRATPRGLRLPRAIPPPLRASTRPTPPSPRPGASRIRRHRPQLRRSPTLQRRPPSPRPGASRR